MRCILQEYSHRMLPQLLFQATYKDDYEKSKDKNVYKVTETDQYKTAAEGQKALSDVRINCIYCFLS